MGEKIQYVDEWLSLSIYLGECAQTELQLFRKTSWMAIFLFFLREDFNVYILPTSYKCFLNIVIDQSVEFYTWGLLESYGMEYSGYGTLRPD